jgi:hypothetical protein
MFSKRGDLHESHIYVCSGMGRLLYIRRFGEEQLSKGKKVSCSSLGCGKDIK